MYAIIEDSGTQIMVTPGREFDVDLREIEEGQDSITFDRVLAVGERSSDDPAQIGTPYLEGATVTADLIGEVRGEKIDVIKFKRRKGYRRKAGHRQRYLRVKIGDISTD